MHEVFNQFLIAWEMQQSPSYGRELEYRYPYFFPKYWFSFSWNSHPMALCATWDMLRFSCEFLTVLENATKPVLLQEPGILIPILLPSYSSFCSIEFPSYGILQTMDGTCVSTRISCSMVKFQRNAPIIWEIPGILIPILSSNYWLFFFRQTPVSWNAKKRTPYFLQIVSLSTYNSHRTDLKVLCTSTIQHYMEQVKLLKTFLTSVSHCIGLNIP